MLYLWLVRVTLYLVVLVAFGWEDFKSIITYQLDLFRQNEGFGNGFQITPICNLQFGCNRNHFSKSFPPIQILPKLLQFAICNFSVFMVVNLEVIFFIKLSYISGWRCRERRVSGLNYLSSLWILLNLPLRLVMSLAIFEKVSHYWGSMRLLIDEVVPLFGQLQRNRIFLFRKDSISTTQNLNIWCSWDGFRVLRILCPLMPRIEWASVHLSWMTRTKYVPMFRVLFFVLQKPSIFPVDRNALPMYYNIFMCCILFWYFLILIP